MLKAFGFAAVVALAAGLGDPLPAVEAELLEEKQRQRQSESNEPAAKPADPVEVERMRCEVETLRQEVAALRSELAEFRTVDEPGK
jgi:hypothetical protein